MSFIEGLSLIISIVLLVYLFYVLMKGEKL